MIDTHIHLLEPDKFTYRWAEEFPALAGRFDLLDYQKVTSGLGIEGGVFMEVDCDESAEEAQYFCKMAEEPGCLIQSVVAAARPEEDTFEKYLDSIAHPKLVGIRRVLHTKPDELSHSSLFRRHIDLLGKRGLSFDLCVTERQLPAALKLAKACSETQLILDHCGCPDIASHTDASHLEFWTKQLRAMATLPHVAVKLSGITTYAASAQRKAESLRPYFETLLDSFGPDRLLWGGDWPVVNLGDGLPAWIRITRELVSALNEDNQRKILTSTAKRIYRIP
jgi:predicted TIM-barrel fold metal-dependent hydrolase